jgi:hypothetical protein
MNHNSSHLQDDPIRKLQLSLYLLPIVGIIPALFTLNSKYSCQKQKKVSTLSLKLFFFWLLSYICLWLGAIASSEVVFIRLLYLNGILTTGYFLTCLVFALLIWRGKMPRLPFKLKISLEKPKN